MFRRIDYLNGLKGHTEYTSSNVLRNSIKTAINLDSNYQRFKPEINAGQFAESYYIPTSFTY